MKPESNPLSLYAVVAGVAGQVGCLLFIIIGGALLLGLFLDQQFGTKPLFLFVLLLGSLPLNFWLVYRYTLYRAKRLQAPSTQKEDHISDD
jgi:F0F1-type ATP synthase assembly protein I